MKRCCLIILVVAVVMFTCSSLSLDVHAANTIPASDSASATQMYNLPDAILQGNTEQLLDAILSYPYLIELVTSNTSIIDAYTTLKTQFNGFREFEKRNDAGTILLNRYMMLSNRISSCTTELSRSDIMNHLYLELLLSLPDYSNKLTHSERTSLTTISQTYTSDLEAQDEVTSVATQSSTPAVITANGFMYDLSDQTAKTTGGLTVPLYEARSDYSESQKTAMAQTVVETYGVTLVSLPTSLYNCHSYAWYKSSSSNTYFVNDVVGYIADVHSSSSNSPTVNSIAIYMDSSNNPVHSAIVTKVDGDTITCRSKWGANGLYQHELDNVPNSYKVNGQPKCVYISITPHNSPTFTAHNTTSHKGTCTVCNQVYYMPHNLTVTSYNSSTHTRRCTGCGWTATDSHTINSVTSKCLYCPYQGITTIAALTTDQSQNAAFSPVCVNYK